MISPCIHFSVVRTADSSYRPSKVHGAVLPQEYTLLQFLGKIDLSEASWSTQTPACEWKYVICNEELEVTHIHWDYLPTNLCFSKVCLTNVLQGELLWQYLPHTLIHFSAQCHGITGPIDFSVLPSKLVNFYIGSNKCDGSLDLSHLPSSLNVLFLSHNKFTGEIDLTCLPGSISEVHVRDNRLYGALNFSKLPRSLRGLDLSNNCFVVPEHVPDVVIIGLQNTL